MHTILVTGASGFIGTHVVRQLASLGHKVVAVGRKAINLPGIHHAPADLMSPGAIRDVMRLYRPSHCMHLAWYVEHGKFWNANENQAWDVASRALIRQFSANEGHRFVSCGTCAEYLWLASRPVYAESDDGNTPDTEYGRAKLSFFRDAQKFSPMHDLSYAHGRLFFPFGPGEPPQKLIASTISALLAGRQAHTANAHLIRDLIFVDDIASALIAVLFSPSTGAVNIGTGNGTMLINAVEEIGRQLGRTELLSIGSHVANAAEVVSIVADTQRLNGEVGWNHKVELAEGIARTIQFARETDGEATS